MPLDDEVVRRLWHIVSAGTTITKWTRSLSFNEYRDSRMLRDAVEREFITIGEALSAALRVDETLASAITGTAGIIGFRHMLVHSYATVLTQSVWEIIHDHLPVLLTEVRALLGPSPA